MKNSNLKKSLTLILFLISFILMPNILKASSPDFRINPYIIMGERGQLYLKFKSIQNNDLSLQAEAILNDNKMRKFNLNVNKLGPITIIPIEDIECSSNVQVNLKQKVKSLNSSLLFSKKFPTLPCNKFDELNFIFISDTQNSTGHLKSISKIIGKFHEKKSLHFILHGGDFVKTGGSQKMWKNYFEMQRNYSNIPLIPVIGNHEYYGDFQNKPLSSNYKKYMGNPSKSDKGYSLLSFQHFNLIRLNSNFDRLKEIEQEEQKSWLKEALEQSKQSSKKTIISFHHSPFSSVSSKSSFHVKKLRNEFVPLFEEYNKNIILVLTGHSHLYERSIKNNIHYLVSGPAGGIRAISLRKNPYSVFKKPFRSTFTHFKIENDIMELRTYSRKGKLIDFLTLYL